jgi:hypothetical protein
MKKQIITLAGFIVLLLSGKLFVSSTMSSPDDYGRLFEHRYHIFALELPYDVSFAGETVPLTDEAIRQRFDRELNINTYWQTQTSLLIRRAFRFFPVIRPILRKNGVPDDFKYLPLIESGFHDMVSPAGAEGPWQFLPRTARMYGLTVDNAIDERYDLAKSTEAACRYFKQAYKRLGNWTLVAAAYNMGISGVATAAQRQSATNYYDMALNIQTSRYVFRLVAIKEIMEHPRRYGFHFVRRSLYAPIPTLKVKVSAATNLVRFARSYGITFQTLKELNPWVKNHELSDNQGKTYYLYIPKDRKARPDTTREPQFIEDSLLANAVVTDPVFFPDTFHAEKNAGSENTVIGEAGEHVVAKGESLDRIARHYKVTVNEIMEWNKLRSDKLKPGQKLIIDPEKIGKGKNQEKGKDD